MKTLTANALWVASCFPAWRRFYRAVNQVKETQAGLLSGYMQNNRDTQYGQKHGFSSITTPEKFQQKLPLTTYDDYSSAVERIGAGETSVLTAEPVLLFELSSGSTAPSKLVPYTAGLKAEFQRGIAAWIYNLYKQMPDLMGGPAYWSITPIVDQKQTTPAGIPIGFETDSAYLGILGKWLVNSVMAVPDGVKQITDIDTFRYVTLFHLLSRADLRLISVWNPTFLTLLLQALQSDWDNLVEDIALGRVPTPAGKFQTTPNAKRARRLQALSPTDYTSIWRELKLISCWTDGPSAPYAARLQEEFPHVAVQGKGLLATEAFVSLPVFGLPGSVLAVNAHFFEFVGGNGDVLFAHQVRKGEVYEIVVTTGGGFYRYRMQDYVEIVGMWGQSPCIRFIGKKDRVSDWFGEKLDERFVADVLKLLYAKHAVTPSFSMLAPDDEDGFRYLLFLESVKFPPGLELELDDALRANFHYDYCRKLGQLEMVRIHPVRHGVETFMEACRERGQKLGDIKPAFLHKDLGWKAWFDRSKESREGNEIGDHLIS